MGVLRERYPPWKRTSIRPILPDCIEEDMKQGMLLSTGKKAGLDDEFFYNNAQECSNFKYKSKILEEKMNTSPGYRPHVKCTWTEALVLYRNLVEEVNRDKQRAVLRKGSFVLADRFKYLEIPLHIWSTMTPRERQAHLAKGDSTVKQGLLRHWYSTRKMKDLALQAPWTEVVPLDVLRMLVYQNVSVDRGQMQVGSETWKAQPATQMIQTRG